MGQQQPTGTQAGRVQQGTQPGWTKVHLADGIAVDYIAYYWLDPVKKVTGLIMTQILPFADQRALKFYGQFERSVYDALKPV